MQDGVYLNLPHADYLAVPHRLGSTDITRLYAQGLGWWWTSAYNPHHVAKSSEFHARGSAFHALFFEGRKEYQTRFAVMPNPRDFPNLLRTMDDLRSALAGAGQPEPKKSTSKGELVNLAKAHVEGANIWDDIVERWGRDNRRKTPIESADAFAMEAMYAAAMHNPTMRLICGIDGDIPLAEVSVFYTCALGLKKRFRFDRLHPDANVDAKSITDTRSMDFGTICADRVAREHLDIQLAMGHEARLAAYRLIEEGRLFHSSGEPWASVTLQKHEIAEFEYITQFPKARPLNHQEGGVSKPGWGWCWVFYQWPDGGKAPEVLPVLVGYGEDLHRSGWNKMRIAAGTFQEGVATFGLNTPWTRVRPIHGTHETSSNRFVLPPWTSLPDAQPGLGEAMKWR